MVHEQPSFDGQSAQATVNPSLPPFYKNAELVDSQKHANLRIREEIDLSFSADINAIPINLVEMPQICHVYPIVFSANEDATPVAIVGVRDDENLFVNEHGEWLYDAYIPGYVRRYPFIFSPINDGEHLALCLEMDDNIIADRGGQRLFNEDGSPSPLAQDAIEFCKSFQAAAEQTRVFCQALADSGLLVDRAAKIEVPGHPRVTFSGIRVVDEEKLAQMSDEDFLKWRSEGWLPFLYAHILSGTNWQLLTRLLDERIKTEQSSY